MSNRELERQPTHQCGNSEDAGSRHRPVVFWSTVLLRNVSLSTVLWSTLLSMSAVGIMLWMTTPTIAQSATATADAPAPSRLQSIKARSNRSKTTKVTAAGLRRVMTGRPPASVSDLRQVQKRIRALTSKIMPATVAIQVGRANGSGVIIDREGHVLTAAHVAGRPGRTATIYLPNGRELRGVTLGMNQKLDAGLIRINDPGADIPFVPLGNSDKLSDGEFCLATGHPGGYDAARPPVLRWGRILRLEDSAILTDCTLVGGDSGGPLFNLDGEVVGIHSRIGKNLTINVHVPIDTFVNSWSRLIDSELWGLLDEDKPKRRTREAKSAWLGVTEAPFTGPGARIRRIVPDSPAEAAGLKAGDLILSVDGDEISNFTELQTNISGQTPNKRVDVTLIRDERQITLRVRLGSRVASN